MVQIEGTLTHWQDDRGFGFIQPSDHSEHVFVHIKAFKSPSRRPQLNQQVLFQVETTVEGKKRAINVLPKQVALSLLPSDKPFLWPALWGLAAGIGLLGAALWF